MKLKLNNYWLMLLLLFIILVSSYSSLSRSGVNELFKVEGFTAEQLANQNVNDVSGVSQSVIENTNNLSEYDNNKSISSDISINDNVSTTYDPNRFSVNTVNNLMGISRNQIPSGDEDLYILKSQVVPPVCPACPTVTACPRQEPPPPCPPCARCPEPSFECQKVPNYSSNNVSRYVPRPVLADFSQFGM